MKYFLILILFFHLNIRAKSQNTQLKALDAKIEAFKMSAALKSAVSGFCLLDPVTGKVITSYNKDISLIPASTQKIIITSAALELLGKDFRFQTTLLYDGYIDTSGVLHGNVYITGGGDPTLGSAAFIGYPNMDELTRLFIAQIQALGIAEIEGSIIADDSYFSDCLTPESWLGHDLGNYFAASPSGLNILENSYRLYLRPGKFVGDKTEIIGTEPSVIPGLELKNEVKTFKEGSGDQALINTFPSESIKYVQGTIPMGPDKFFIKGAVPDPASLAALMIYNALTNSGIQIKGEALKLDVTLINKNKTKFYTHYSPSLIEIVKQINLRSQNLYAENLLIMLGKYFKGYGTYESGIEVTSTYWESRGLDINGMSISDGSGLSLMNKMTPYQLAFILYSLQLEELFKDFKASLPTAGMTGTLKNFCKNNNAKGKIFAKSGTMSRIRCYTGYAQATSGKFYPFALMINDIKGNTAPVVAEIERLMVALVEME